MLVDLDLQFEVFVHISTPLLVLGNTRYNKGVPFIMFCIILWTLVQRLMDIVTLSLHIHGKWLSSRYSPEEISVHPKLQLDKCGISDRLLCQAIVTSLFTRPVRAGNIEKVLTLAEEGDYQSLPNGFMLAQSVQQMESYSTASTSFPLRVQNMTGKDIVIPAKVSPL